MKRLLFGMAALCGLAAVWAVAPMLAAQEEGGIQIRGPRGNVAVEIDLPKQERGRVAGPALRATKLVGMAVRNPEGQTLGTVDDLVIDAGTGRSRYVALSFGGFLGVGDKLFAVPFGALQFHTTADGDHHFVLDVSRERLEAAPGFDKDHWPNLADPEWSKQIDEYYGHGAVRVSRR